MGDVLMRVTFAGAALKGELRILGAVCCEELRIARAAIVDTRLTAMSGRLLVKMTCFYLAT